MGCGCSKQHAVDVELRLGSGPFARKGADKPLALDSIQTEWHDATSLARRSTISSIASVYQDCLEQSLSGDVFNDPYYSVAPPSPLQSTGSGVARLLALTEADSFKSASTSGGGGGDDGSAAAEGRRDSSASGSSASCPAGWAPRTSLAPSASLCEAPVEYALRRYKQGDIYLCRTVAELLSYQKASGLALDEIERIMVDAETRVDAAAAALHQQRRQEQEREQERQRQLQEELRQQEEERVRQPEQHEESLVSAPGEAAGPSEDGGPRQPQPLQSSQEEEPQQQQQQQQQQQPPQQQQQSLPCPPSPGRRWVPTSGDCLTPGVRPLPTAGLGIGGADLFSAAHVMAHLRAAAAMLESLEISKGWRQVSHGALQIWHHHDRQQEVQEFRVQCVINEAMLNMISICREVDLSMAWNPTVTLMKTICQASLSEVIVYLGLWYPWPLSEPELQWRCLGLDLLSHDGGVLVTIQDVGDTPAGLELPPSSASRTRYRIKQSCMRFSPMAPDPDTGEPRMEVAIVARLDTRASMIPDSFLSFLIKVFAPLVYRNVVSTCRRLFQRAAPAGSPLTLRQRERSDLYHPQARSIDRFMRSKGWMEQIPLLPALAGGARAHAGAPTRLSRGA